VQKRVQFWQSQKLCKNWHCRDPLDRDGSLSARLIIICRRLNQNEINLVFLTLTVWQIQEKLKNNHLDVARTSEQGGLGCDEKRKRKWL